MNNIHTTKRTWKAPFGGLLLAITMFFGIAQTAKAQYCVPSSLGGACITNVTFGTINNTTVCEAGFYNAFANTITTNLTRGLTVPITITTDNTAIVSVWIDFNANNTFDATEWVQPFTTGTTGTLGIAIPGTATAGVTKMRVRSRSSGFQNTAGDACSTTFGSGEAEDYFVTIVGGTPCAGAPAANTSVSSATSVCSGAPFTLSLGTTYTTTGITYQWQSAVLPAGTYGNITGATSSTYAATQTVATGYRCIITCSSAPVTTTATAVNVTMNAPSACYCPASVAFGGDTDIGNVTFGTLNNGSATPILSNPLAIGTYTDNTAIAAPSVARGTSVPLSLSQITSDATFYTAIFAVYIDYNQDGDFADSGELAFSSTALTSGTAATQTGTVFIPTNATVGNTRMRVLLNEATSVTPVVPSCNPLLAGFGEVEDYTVNITAGTACTGAPTAGTASSSTTTAICPGVNFTLSLTGFTAASGISFQWQSSPTAIGTYTNITAATSFTLTTSATATAFYRCVVTCVTTNATSNAVSVTINAATYATVPYTQGFESAWLTTCVTAPLGQDTPDASWRMTAGADNDASWRADNTTTVLSGWSSVFGAYTPTGANASARSARFHSYNVFPAGVQSFLDLYINLSSVGAKQLSFDYITPSTGIDQLEVLLSTDGGATFTALTTTPAMAAPATAVTAWTNVTANITSLSATAVIRFRATGDNGSFDIGLDNVSVTGAAACPTITFANTTIISPNAVVGTAYSLNGGATASSGTLGYVVSPVLPAGLTISATSGLISGIPTATAASATYTVTASTSTTCTATQTYTFAVNAAGACSGVVITLTPATLPNATVGTAYSQALTAAGGTGTYTFTTNGVLPAGLALSSAGVITGTPTVASTSVTFVVTATATGGCFGTRSYSLVINPNPATAIGNALSNLVKVSPNPSSNDFNVDFGGLNMNKATVRVYDAQGKNVFSADVKSNLMTISLDKLATGIYLMEVETSKGRILKRLAKQ